jgi:surface protein
MQSHTINQLVKINVYNTEADMPHGFALFWQNFVKYLPTITLIICGLIVVALIVFIVFKYHKSKHFWRQFSVAMSLLALLGWGVYGFHRYSYPLTLGADTIYIDIVKDSGSMTASSNGNMDILPRWTYGHTTYAKAGDSNSNISFLGGTVSATPEEDQIKLFMNNVELPNDSQYVSSSYDQEEEYTVVASVDPEIAAGRYERGIVLAVSQTDSMMSALNNLVDDKGELINNTDITEPTSFPSDQQFITDASCVDAVNNTICEEINKALKNADASMSEKGLHKWLNAPDPIRRENIKSIKFNDGTHAIDAPEPEHGCWDISENQTGTVVACYDEQKKEGDWAVEGNEKGTGLIGWFSDFFGASEETIAATCRRDYPSIDDDASTTDVNEHNVREAEYNKCVNDKMQKVPLGIYDIVIYQQGGVQAPQNSSYLFYYTGQNTNYCMYGSKTVVDPSIGSATAMINRIKYTSANSGGIHPIASAIDAYAIFELRMKLLIQMEPAYYEDQGFWSKVFTGDHNVSRIKDYFRYCHQTYIEGDATTIDFTNFKTDAVDNMSHMFDGATFGKLGDALKNLKSDNVTDMSYMFANITDHQAGKIDLSSSGLKFDKTDTMAGMFSGSRFEKITMGKIGSTTNLNSMFAAAAGPTEVKVNKETIPGVNCVLFFCGLTWSDPGPNYGSLTFSVKSGDIQLGKMETIKVTDMGHLFEGAQAKIYASPEKFKTMNVTDMSYMFTGAQYASIKLDLKHFDTTNVTNMNGMFLNTKFTSVDLSSFNTSKVQSMARMFEACDTSELDLSKFDTSAVTDTSNMFFNAKVKKVNFGNKFKTGNVSNMSGMFANTVFDSASTSISFDTKNVTNMSMMFFNAKNLNFVKTTSFNTEKVTDMSYMFANFKIAPPKSQTITSYDENTETVSKSESKGQKDCRKDDGLYVTDFKHKDKGSQDYLTDSTMGVDMTSSRNASGDFDCTDVDNGIFGESWASKFQALLDISARELNNWRDADLDDYGKNYNTTTNLDLSSFNTKNVLNMEGMFLGAQYPTIKLNNTKFKTDKVTNMAYMFAMISAKSLDSKTAGFNTENVETMEGMFAGTLLNGGSLDLSSFTKPKLTNSSFMFAYSNITPSGFNPESSTIENNKHVYEHKV